MIVSTAFAYNSSVKIKLSKSQLHKTGQSEGFQGKLIGLLVKTGFYLMKNVLKLLPKSILMQLGLPAAALPTDAAIQKKLVKPGMTNFKWRKWMVLWKCLKLIKNLFH